VTEPEDKKKEDIHVQDALRHVLCFSDPYVKIWLLYEDKKVEKQKTQTKQRTTEPCFNESFVFNVSYDRIRRTALSISVMDRDHIGPNEKIGGVIVGSRSGPNETKHWNEMLARPRIPTERWHMLKDFD